MAINVNTKYVDYIHNCNAHKYKRKIDKNTYLFSKHNKHKHVE